METIFNAHPDLDGFLITNPKNIFWLSGFLGSFGKILILKEGSKYLISDGRYAEIGTKISNENNFNFVLYNADFKTKFAEKITGKIGVEMTLSLSKFETLKQHFSGATLVPISDTIETLRRSKTGDEILKIEHAQSHVDKILVPFLRHNLKPGVTEAQLNFKLRDHLMAQGKFDLSFPSIVAFGQNSAKPHAVSGDRTLKLGDNILVDCGVFHKHYASDMTRNFVFGNPHQKYLEKYELLARAQTKTNAKIKAGVTVRLLDTFCRQQLGDDAEFFTHSLGHGVGLDIHEAPRISVRSQEILRASEVITNEPGLYYPGQFGIRIEDLVVVRKNGCEILSQTTKDLLSFDEDGQVRICAKI